MLLNKQLKGVKVLDLSSVLAGPSVGMFFAELGAKVIKVENKKSNGDVTLTWRNAKEPADTDMSAYYASINWGKKVHQKDYTKSKDLEWILKKVAESDIVVCNFKKGDDVKFGLDYNSLKKFNPQLIYGHISGFGDFSGKVAFDLVLQAETGFMSMNGTKQSGPLKMPVALIDVLAAHQLKEGILLAMLNKLQTGKGKFVQVSLYESALASLVNQASNYLNAGFIPELSGSLHPNIAPYGETFVLKDKNWITFAIGSDKQFEVFWTKLGIKEEFSSFKSNRLRLKNRNKLSEILQVKLQTFDKQLVEEVFSNSNIPYGYVNKIDSVIGNYLKKGGKLLSYKNGMKVIPSVAFKWK